MTESISKYEARKRTLSASLRLVRVIIIEALLVAIVGFLVWGVAWDLGYPIPGLVIAIIIWLTVSPVIEIATVMNYRKAASERKA